MDVQSFDCRLCDIQTKFPEVDALSVSVDLWEKCSSFISAEFPLEIRVAFMQSAKRLFRHSPLPNQTIDNGIGREIFKMIASNISLLKKTARLNLSFFYF